jgi:hypothetical protein
MQEQLDIANDQISKLNTEMSYLKIQLHEINKERDFYFSKLKDIEFLISKDSSLDKIGQTSILKQILYSEKEVEVFFDEKGNVEVK